MSRHAILGSNIPLCQSPCKALPRTAGVIQHTQIFTKNRSAAGGGSWWDRPSFHNSSTDSCLKWRLSPPSALYLFVRVTGPTSAVTICSHAAPRARSAAAPQRPSEVVSLKYNRCSGACWQNTVLHVPDSSQSQPYLLFYHLLITSKNPEVGS